MEIFLIRHAEAAPRTPDSRDDQRALTPKGRKRFHRVVDGLDRLGVHFDSVIFSPLLRAQETADIVLELCTGESQVAGELAGPPSGALPGWLADFRGRSLAVIGHEPWLSQLAARLLFPTAGIGGADTLEFMHIAKGGVVHLSGDPAAGAMTLAAFYPPRVLRKLSRR